MAEPEEGPSVDGAASPRAAIAKAEDDERHYRQAAERRRRAGDRTAAADLDRLADSCDEVARRYRSMLGDTDTPPAPPRVVRGAFLALFRRVLSAARPPASPPIDDVFAEPLDQLEQRYEEEAARHEAERPWCVEGTRRCDDACRGRGQYFGVCVQPSVRVHGDDSAVDKLDESPALSPWPADDPGPEPDEIVHRYQFGADGLTLCCGRRLAELPIADRVRVGDGPRSCPGPPDEVP